MAVRWANQVMNLNIINVGAQAAASGQLAQQRQQRHRRLALLAQALREAIGEWRQVQEAHPLRRIAPDQQAGRLGRPTLRARSGDGVRPAQYRHPAGW